MAAERFVVGVAGDQAFAAQHFGKDAIDECARSYRERRGRDATDASEDPLIAAALTRADWWRTRNLARIREVVGTAADLPAWSPLESWARDGLRRYFERVEKAERLAAKIGNLEAENAQLTAENAELRAWRELPPLLRVLRAWMNHLGPASETPTQRTKPAPIRLDVVQPLYDMFPSDRNARPLWQGDEPMALGVELLKVGHVALRRARAQQPLSSSVAAHLVAPLRKLLPNAARESSDDELLGVALVNATRVGQLPPLDPSRPKDMHYVAFIAEVEQLHADLEGEDLADLWAVSACAAMPSRDVMKLSRGDLRRTWCRRLRKYRERERPHT